MSAADAVGRGFVLVTGASTGIGLACALHLDALGFRVIAGVRREEDAERVRAQASGRLSTVSLDVTAQASIDSARTRVDTLVGEHGLAGLVNNAGIGIGGPLEYLPMARLRQQFEVNYFGVIAVTQAFLPAIRRATGRIINMSSIAGRMSAPMYGPYASAKHALEAASDALRNELKPWGIHVVVLEPGVISTPIWSKAADTAEETLAEIPEEGRRRYDAMIRAVLQSAREAEEQGLPPSAVAECVAHALMASKPRTRYTPGRDAAVGVALKRLLPDRVMDSLTWRRLGLPRNLRVD